MRAPVRVRRAPQRILTTVHPKQLRAFPVGRYYRTTRHPQRVVMRGRLCALVDVELAGLMRNLWRHGIRTVMSCQGGPEPVWIVFERQVDFARFLRLAEPFSRSSAWRVGISTAWQLNTVWFPRHDLENVQRLCGSAPKPDSFFRQAERRR
jgi:hypothetical protein